MRVAEIAGERGDAAAEIVEPSGELADRGSLVDVRVPAAGLGEGDLEPDVRLDQLRDLAKRVRRRPTAGSRRRVSGWYFRRVGRLEHSHRVERLAARSIRAPVGRGRVLRFERRLHHVGRLAGADAELADLAHGQRRLGALQRARQLRRERDGAERRCRRVLTRVKVAIQPAVLRALHAGRCRLHVVLRVEVRSRAVRRTRRRGRWRAGASPRAA